MPSVANPHVSLVRDLYQDIEIQAELLGERGIVRERIRHANIVSFVCLKAFAFDDRLEDKDAYDLLYCIENVPGGVAATAAAFRDGVKRTSHGDTIHLALEILRKRFATRCFPPSVRAGHGASPVALA